MSSSRTSDASSAPSVPPPVSYVLPLKAHAPDDELDGYLHRLAGEVDDLIVVDGSSDDLFGEHRRRWPAPVRHLRPATSTPMGKVGNVLTGLAAARHEIVVIADDDVRWTQEQLRRAVDGMADASVARPQNSFAPVPWHARWDTGRTLIHRALGGDWPGTLLVRRSALPCGYAGDALFENLELVRTARAQGGRERVLLDVVVERRPPTTAKFLEQRVRQAYDEWARPGYLLTELALLPAVVRWRGRGAAGVAAGAMALAEVGRRRAGGTAHWPPTAALWAPAWAAERAVTAWCAVALRAMGGVRFGENRLARAAHSLRQLRERHGAEPHPGTGAADPGSGGQAPVGVPDAPSGGCGATIAP